MKFVNAREAEALIAAGGLEVIDVREPRETAAGHVPGARLVPLDRLRAEPKNLLKRDKLLFVCARGGRSQTAARIAEELGFTDVSSLDGGTEAWAIAGLPLEVPPPPPEADKKAEVPEVAEAPLPELDAVIGTNMRTLRDQRGL